METSRLRPAVSASATVSAAVSESVTVAEPATGTESATVTVAEPATESAYRAFCGTVWKRPAYTKLRYLTTTLCNRFRQSKALHVF